MDDQKIGLRVLRFLFKSLKNKFLEPTLINYKRMKDNFYFMDEYFMGITFSCPPQQIGPQLLWFEPEYFKKVIDVCQKKGLGISTIEVYKGGYADTLLSKDFGGNPYDPDWYMSEYENLIKKYCVGTDNRVVLFSGWYLEPNNINKTTTYLAKAGRTWWQKLFGSE